jgi:hypothetical protein
MELYFAAAGRVHHEVAPVAGHDGVGWVAVGAPAHGAMHAIVVLHLHGLSLLRRHFISSVPRLFFE